MAALPNKHVGWILTGLAILVGTAWRASHLENRPLHADEAVQAWQTWNLLSGEGYTYDPWDRHGPTLYYASAWLHQLRGGDASDYDDRAARRTALAAGTATLILMGFGPRRAGFIRGTGAIAVTLLVFETFSSLYHTYFVQEAGLAFLIWAFVLLALTPAGDRPVLKALVLGLIAGLAQATKEITPGYLLFAVGALVITRPRGEAGWKPRHYAAALLGALIPYGLFYSSFGSNPVGLIDGVRTYLLQTDRLTANPHTYPWWYPLRTLGVIPSGGPNWGQYLLLMLGLAGGLSALHASATRAHRVTALFTAALFLFHSIIPYKTPWLLLTPMIGGVLLAGTLLARVAATSRWSLGAVVVVVGLTGAQSWAKSQLALDRYPGDERNPYFYEQAPRGLAKLPDRIDRLQAASDSPLRIAVISPEHAWPLPWYLREEPLVGYFSAAPETMEGWDIIIWDNQLGEPVIDPVAFPVVEFYGLRPRVLLYTFINRSTWERVFPPLPTIQP